MYEFDKNTAPNTSSSDSMFGPVFLGRLRELGRKKFALHKNLPNKKERNPDTMTILVMVTLGPQ